MNTDFSATQKNDLTQRDKLHGLLNFVINKYIFLGLCSGGITVFSYYSLRLTTDWLYILLVILATSILYNNHGLLSVPISKVIDYLKGHHLPTLFILISAILFIKTVSVSYFWIFILAILIVLGYYSVSVFKKITFRQGWIKPLSIGSVYGLITLTYPALSNHLPVFLVFMLTLERTIFIGALALIFDVGDAEKDKFTCYPTVPSRLGIQNSIIIAIAFIILAGIVNIYAYYETWITTANFYALTITYILSSILFKEASPNKTKHQFYLTYIDGMIGLPFFIFLITRLGLEIISHI